MARGGGSAVSIPNAPVRRALTIVVVAVISSSSSSSGSNAAVEEKNMKKSNRPPADASWGRIIRLVLLVVWLVRTKIFLGRGERGVVSIAAEAPSVDLLLGATEKQKPPLAVIVSQSPLKPHITKAAVTY